MLRGRDLVEEFLRRYQVSTQWSKVREREYQEQHNLPHRRKGPARRDPATVPARSWYKGTSVSSRKMAEGSLLQSTYSAGTEERSPSAETRPPPAPSKASPPHQAKPKPCSQLTSISKEVYRTHTPSHPSLATPLTVASPSPNRHDTILQSLNGSS